MELLPSLSKTKQLIGKYLTTVASLFLVACSAGSTQLTPTSTNTLGCDNNYYNLNPGNEILPITTNQIIYTGSEFTLKADIQIQTTQEQLNELTKFAEVLNNFAIGKNDLLLSGNIPSIITVQTLTMNANKNKIIGGYDSKNNTIGIETNDGKCGFLRPHYVGKTLAHEFYHLNFGAGKHWDFDTNPELTMKFGEYSGVKINGFQGAIVFFEVVEKELSLLVNDKKLQLNRESVFISSYLEECAAKIFEHYIDNLVEGNIELFNFNYPSDQSSVNIYDGFTIKLFEILREDKLFENIPKDKQFEFFAKYTLATLSQGGAVSFFSGLEPRIMMDVEELLLAYPVIPLDENSTEPQSSIQEKTIDYEEYY